VVQLVARDGVAHDLPMARPSIALASAIRSTAARLRAGSAFAWGHMGRCNCGHLAQTLTSRTAAELHAAAQERCGDWREQTREYCPTSGLAIDVVIEELLAAGLSLSDLRHLEDLSDPVVLARVPARFLRRSDVRHTIQYMEAWAEVMETELQRPGPTAPTLTRPRDAVSSPR
jgi:hypothetical protein